MSDKKKSEQTPADKKSSAANSNVDHQTDLSASINMTSSHTEPSPKPLKSDESSENTSLASDKMTQAEASVDKNHNKSTENVKNSASITSKSANNSKPQESNSTNTCEKKLVSSS